MQNNEAVLQRSRSELIKQARESCSKNLYPSRVKSSSLDNKRSVNSHQEVILERGYNRSVIGAKVEPINALSAKAISAKLLMLRIVIAVVLFGLIVFVDQFHFTYNSLNSNTIEKVVASNESAKRAIDFVTVFTKEKIIDVFNGLH